MKALVTGGAGFIGSHLVRLLAEKGHEVVVFDALEEPTHPPGETPTLPDGAAFLRADVRDKAALSEALAGVEAVFHLAATGGFTPDVAKYVEVNSLGTANLIEAIAANTMRPKALVVASSVGVYGEGRYECPRHGVVHPPMRPIEQLERGEWEQKCTRCGLEMTPLPTTEGTPVSPEKPYSISKYDAERLCLNFGREAGVRVCALRYFLTYGPGQSPWNPYTGICSIFSSRLANGLPPVIFEDGLQARDFVFVEDVARATHLVYETAAAPGVYNVGTGRAMTILSLAKMLAREWGKDDLEPELPRKFRPGESRHVFADSSRLSTLGWEPQVPLGKGLLAYVEWAKKQGREGFDELSSRPGGELERKGVIRNVVGASDRVGADRSSMSVVIPAFNEAGNIEPQVRCVLAETEKWAGAFEVLIVNDGSSDGTGTIADKLAEEDPRVRVVHHPFNIGYGGAQKTGFRHARYEWVALIPADQQFDVRDLRRYQEKARQTGADIVVGRRVARKDPWTRIFVSRCYNWFMRTFYGLKLGDTNWVKVYRRSVFDEIDIQSHGFAVDAEILVRAMRKGRRIAEIDVIHYPRTWGSGTGVRILTILKTARELLRFWRK